MPPSRPSRGRRRELAVAIAVDGREHREIADAAGIAAQTLSGILTGRIRDPRAGTRAAIAEALGRREGEIFPEYASTPAVIDDDTEPAAEDAQPGLTDEQMDFIGAVVYSDLRRLKVAANT